MHFKNNEDDNNKSNFHHSTATSMTSTTSTGSSTSSADSGVIIFDSLTTYSKPNNNNGNNNANSNSNSNSNSNNNGNAFHITKNHSAQKNASVAPQNNNNDNTRCCNLERLGEQETYSDKIENIGKVVDNSTWKNVEKLNSNSYCVGNINCSGSNDHSCNKHKNINTKNIKHSNKNNKNNNNNNNKNSKCNISDNENNDNYNNDECNNINVQNINIENVIKVSNVSHEMPETSTATKNVTVDCHSPAVSIRSTSISIVSIDENAIDSSILDSDSDREADAEGVHTNYVVKKLGQQTTFPAGSSDLPNINKGLTVLSQKISPDGVAGSDILKDGFVTPMMPSKLSGGGGSITPATPQIGSIALTNSTDVTFGDKHFYEGPVTIQQILIDRRENWKTGKEDGHDNPSFENEADGCRDKSSMKCDPLPTSNRSLWSVIRRRKFIIAAAIIVVLTALIGVIVLTTKQSQSSSDEDADDSSQELLVMRRGDWSARPPKGDLDKLDLPVHRVIISHTASGTCMEKETCIDRVRVIQDFHMDSMDFYDIGYNFLVGGDGRVYSARGWNYQGAHTKGYNIDSIGISFIGTFTTIKPTKRQITATKLLIEEGVRQMKIAPDFCLFGARQLGATESPGLALYDIIKKWPHWSENVQCMRYTG